MNVRCSHTEMVDIDLLVPNPKNPNKHPENQIALLAKIMKHQGWRSPVVVSNRSGFITKGHGRLEAAKLNGWTEVPVDRQDYETEADEYADMVADNKIAELAETDLKMVNDMALELPDDFDFELLGIPDFEPVEIDVLEPQSDENAVPGFPVEPTTKRGDVWMMGEHRLICGDSTDPNSWSQIRSTESTLVFTSPPYGVGNGAKLRDHYVKGATKRESLYNSHVDDPNDWSRLMRDWTTLALAHAHGVVCNVQMLANNKRDLMAWISEFATHMTDIAIWDKGHGPPQMQKNVLTNVFEFLIILSPVENASRTVPMADFHGNESNVVRVGSAKNNEFADVHKATMPIELAEWAIRVVGNTGKHVIDPFGGTGTTLIAAEKAGKTCGLIELDPVYCDVIVKRWENYTGQKAVLVNG